MTEKDEDRTALEETPAHPVGEPGPAEESPPPAAGDALAVLGELAGRFDKVEGQLSEFHRRSAHRESLIDRLHEENQRLRSGIGRVVLEPVVADLIRLYDQLSRVAPTSATVMLIAVVVRRGRRADPGPLRIRGLLRRARRSLSARAAPPAGRGALRRRIRAQHGGRGGRGRVRRARHWPGQAPAARPFSPVLPRTRRNRAGPRRSALTVRRHGYLRN